LLRRAFCDHNDAAWDAIVIHLWSIILQWLYAARPDLTPAAAETLGYRVLWQFRSHYLHHPDLASRFPTFQVLMDDLRSCTTQVVALAPGSSTSTS
jgi:hypothetical protein